jgi:hypothetical protein
MPRGPSADQDQVARKLSATMAFHRWARDGSAEVDGRLVWGPTKTYARSTVPLPRFLCEQLAEYLAERPHGPDDLVFTAPQGGPLRTQHGPRTPRRCSEKAKEQVSDLLPLVEVGRLELPGLVIRGRPVRPALPAESDR